ncbi:MAG: type II toxin-antitoxin system Phd/YefM family antitoxin [Opitutales bacterium]|nr:type II toxin-antitoxin system Phd/YefM family antitoxin [Opitutales bacterium]
MKSVTIRSLKHETGAIMERVALGETVEILRRNQPIAILKPVEKPGRARPDFMKRLEGIYGDRVLPTTATELLAADRGER